MTTHSALHDFIDSFHSIHATRSLLLVMCLGCAGNSMAQSFDDCVLQLVGDPTNDGLTVLEIRNRCEAELTIDPISALTPVEPLAPPDSPGAFLDFFAPYKENYISFGNMQTDNQDPPFSGKTLDIKFELGMKFGLFRDTTLERFIAPLYFGYSQKSWWDIAESSAPFKEHNYNPEVFWDFRDLPGEPGLLARSVSRVVDLVGYEHQSNGRDGIASRSWDRIYASRSFRLDERLSFKLKLWDAVNFGDFNTDIEDYLGNLELSTQFVLSDAFALDLRAMQGRDTETISYELNLHTDWDWMNGQLFLTYYDGYGEALISYNQKTRSLRAGIYFPIGAD